MLSHSTPRFDPYKETSESATGFEEDIVYFKARLLEKQLKGCNFLIQSNPPVWR